MELIVPLKKVVKVLGDSGHLSHPFNRLNPFPLPTGELEDLVHVDDITDPAILLGLKSYQDYHAKTLSTFIARHYPDRVAPTVNIDGQIGPAMLELFGLPRCGEKDVGPDTETDIARAGVGNWRGCHGIGQNFHRVSIHINRANMPDFLKPDFDTKVIPAVVKAMREMGLDPVFDNMEMPVNIRFSWVRSSDGWIGLAIVSNNSTCSSQPIWCQYLATYVSSWENWVRLILHELGHNCGMGHNRNGGIMNSYLLSGPLTWKGDESESQMQQRFGGVAYIPDVPPTPGPGPTPPSEYFEGRYKLYKGGDLYLDDVRVEITTPQFNMRLAHKIEL